MVSEIFLEGRANLRARTVQKNPLVGLREVENVTNLVRTPAGDVAEFDHLALLVGKGGDGAVDHRPGLGVEDGAPRLGRRPPVAVGDEAVRVDGWLVVGRERREWRAARLLDGARSRDVRDDSVDPGLERRAALEAVE